MIRINKIIFMLLTSCISWDSFAENKVSIIDVPCNKDGGKQDTTCGFVEVFENNQAKTGRKIPIHFMILRAKTGSGAKSALLFLAGGPGQSAISSASEQIEDFRLINEKIDIVLVDLRGIGKSNPLHCRLPGDEEHLQDYLGSMFPVNSIRACKDQLQQKADLTLYTTTRAVHDLEEARKALGYSKFNLYGTSYGTRVALEYMRRYPDSIRTAILDGTVPTDMKAPLRHPRDGQRAIETLFTDCESNLQCNNAFPKLRDEFHAVLTRLDAAPARIEIEHPETKRKVALLLSRDVFAEFIRNLLYNTKQTASLPLLIHKAFQNDFQQILIKVLQYKKAFAHGEVLSIGFFLSVTCSEDIPFIIPSEATQNSNATFLGEYRYREQYNACEVWTRGTIPQDFLESVQSKIPVVLISGALDPVSPPYIARDVAKTLSNSLVAIVEKGSHSGWGNHTCVEKLFMDFVERGSAHALELSCLAEIQRPPFTVE